MNRRTFAKSAAATAASLASLGTLKAGSHALSKEPFKMLFSPHDGHFKEHVGKNVLDQIQFAYDHGFRGWEDNRMLQREKSEQEAMGKLLDKLGMTLGVFVAYVDMVNPVMTGNRFDVTKRDRDKEGVRDMLTQKAKDAVELAKRVNAKWCTVVCAATDPSIPHDHQTQNVVEHLKNMAGICEPAGLTMVLEPLNYISHPGLFLQKTSHAHLICKMVGSPSCKILNDLFHQQITEGNLITNMEDAWDEIAYIQVGDVPGRKEPTTGEINYKRVFQWLHDKGYRGIVGMEHGISGKGKEGEQRLIESYREVDLA